jgi:hypothetical protein
MAPNRVFFPQRALDQWLADAAIDFTGRELVIKAVNRRYLLVEAARILQEVSGSEDMYDLVGRVKSVNYLTELGAELLESSMLLGDNAYEIIPGFVGSPAGGTVEVQADGLANSVESPTQREEELLIQHLVKDQGRPARG